MLDCTPLLRIKGVQIGGGHQHGSNHPFRKGD
jgi:hypothetical protein